MTVELRPLGVACNIACGYCYQNPQREAGNFRQPYDLERMKAAAEREGGPFTLFGGEPLLLPLADLEELFRWGHEKYGSSGIQTNGVLIGDEHVALFKKYNVEVGVSVDGPGELNDLRWHVSLERTRRNTGLTLANIERLCREHRPPGLIITLHRRNADADALPRLHEWMRWLDGLGVCSVRLHLLESESEFVRKSYGLSDEENVRALLSFAELQHELKNVRFDALDEMERGLLGHDQNTSCVWHACDPYTTQAVRGVEGSGRSSNCGRTNKDGVDFMKAERHGFERYLALYQTPQEHGGCRGCRFFLMCKGQCPGTAVGGDWRNRSELCGVWKRVFIHLEKRLILRDQTPLSIHPVRRRLERHLINRWSRGGNSTIHSLPWAPPANDGKATDADGSGFRLPPFVRQAFVGEAQRAVWSPRIEAVRSALSRLGVLAAARGMVPLSLVNASPREVFAIHNAAAAHGLHARLLPSPESGRGELLAVGGEAESADYLRAWEAGDADSLDVLAGLPVCCRRAAAESRLAGRLDLVWDSAARWRVSERESDVRCAPALNFLLRPLGIDLLGYRPCSFDCEESERLGFARLALGRETELTEVMDWLEAMLGWPAEWSALHGIAELKTGIVKVVYDTDLTDGKVTVRYHGRALAPDAARGLSFAYRRPKSECSPDTGRREGARA